jgi:hypothetical protein
MIDGDGRLEKELADARADASKPVIIMRSPVLMEDEGRHFYIKGPLPKQEALEWIKNQKDEYFKPSDYYITEV